MAAHGEPGDGRQVMQDVGDWMEGAVVIQNGVGILDVSKSEYSSDFESEEEDIRSDSEEHTDHEEETPVQSDGENEDSENENVENENPENDENNFINRSRLIILRPENRQGRQVLRLGPFPEIFVDENSLGFIYDDNFHNLYPHLFIALQTIQRQEAMEGRAWFQEVSIKPEVLPLFEEAMEYIIGQPKPIGPFDTPEKVEALNDYLAERKIVLINAGKDFHDNNESRPGAEHRLGHLFDTKTSFDMIEYFRVAFKKLGHPLPMSTSASNQYYPELDEYNELTLSLIKQCISNHKSLEMRQRIIALVEERTVLSKNNKTTLNNLIDEMNFMFHRNLEHLVIRSANKHYIMERREMQIQERLQQQQAEMEAREAERLREAAAEAKRQQDLAEQWARDNVLNNLNPSQNTRYSYDQEPSTSSTPPTYFQL